jgi:hypothetical protein
VTLRRIVIAATLALTVACGSAACTTIVPPIDSPLAAATPADPNAMRALAGALATLSAESYVVRVVASHGRTVAGGSVTPSLVAFDMQSATAVEDDALREAVRKIGTSVWLNVAFPEVNSELGVSPQQWISASPRLLKIGTGARFDVASRDPLDLVPLFDGVTAVWRTDATHLAGTVNYTRSRGVSAPNADELSEAGAAASSTPFTATLDVDGRLVAVTIDADGYNPDLTRFITLSAYGSARAPGRPLKASIVPATPQVYQLFNDG